MTEAAVASPSQNAQLTDSAGESDTIATRFGDLQVDPDKVIVFDQGLYGLEHHRRFLMTEVPGWPDFFKLLQAVDDPKLSLIVLPLDDNSGPIDPADFQAACETLGYDRAVTTVIGIVTMRDENSSQVFTVNLKAPLLIDSQRRSGCQYVLASDKYHLRHPLAADQQAGS